MNGEEHSLMLSGIQHFVFCKRQWALIHIEAQWAENLRTVEGAILHEKVHELGAEKRDDLIITRNMAVASSALGARGFCDVVEFHKNDKDGITLHGRKGRFLPLPVEYKRGKPKENDADALQLCAQAICLEEMLVCTINEGYLFYGETKRRTPVIFDGALRARVTDCFAQMHGYYRRGYTPMVKPTKACNACSLIDLCLPRLSRQKSAAAYVAARINQEELP